MTTLSAAVVLFLVMDPLGNIPIFFSALKDLTPARRYFVLARELLMALVILLGFLYAGQHILSFLHLRTESVSIAGGIVLFLIGVKMVFPPQHGIFGNQDGAEPFLVPLAIPAVAGPSAMATLLLLAGNQPDQLGSWTISLLAAWSASALLLFGAVYARHFISNSFLIAFERLMGMILVALSVQMTLDGVKVYMAAQGQGP